jgi:hypothetical protein
MQRACDLYLRLAVSAGGDSLQTTRMTLKCCIMAQTPEDIFEAAPVALSG